MHRCLTSIAALLMMGLTAPAAAEPADLFFRWDRNFLVGLGVVGPAQYDQGEPKLMATANLSGFYRPIPSLGFGGVGLAVRATDGPFSYFFESDNFNEFGLAVPVATYRSGRKVAQVGVEIQRYNFQKNFYYVAVGIGWNARKPGVRAAR